MKKEKKGKIKESYNTKWTDETVLQRVNEMLEYLLSHKKICLMMDLFLAFDMPDDYFVKWQDNFQNNNEITEKLNKLEKIIQSRLVNPALKGTHSSNFTQFYLKNKYAKEYRDKQEVEIHGSLLDVLKELDDSEDDEE